MKALDFLQMMWPEAGPYCIAYPFVSGPDARPRMGHRVFDSIESAAAFCEAQKSSTDIFYAVHTLLQDRVWNPNKRNFKTGQLGAWEIRTQSNMAACKALFFDIDIKSDNEKHYPDRTAALLALKQFCQAIGLPQPTVVASGGGLHVYWLLTEAVPSARWREIALKLKQLAEAEKLLVDPVVIADTARVLRVVGTLHRKDPNNLRPVAILHKGVPQTVEALEALLDTALISRGKDTKPAPAPKAPLSIPGIEDNTTREYPTVSARALLENCAQIRDVVSRKGNVAEPLWYHSLNIVRFLEDGRTRAHSLSNGHPKYSEAETDAKLDQLESRGIGPSSCATIAGVCGNEICQACPHVNAGKNPLIVSQLRDEAPAPVVQLVVGAPPLQVPSPPKPFARLKSGGIAVISSNADGDEDVRQIFEYDLYPLRRVADITAQTEQQMWRVELPRNDTKDFAIDADALYEKRKFMITLANNGIYPHPAVVQDLQAYMIAYIKELQRQNDAELQYRHLGWTPDYSGFILPEQMILSDGTTKSVSLSSAASIATDYIRQTGTLERQVELLKFYTSRAYVAQQFYILAGLAAPIFHMTGQHGVIVNASGDPGTSKSTSLYTVASLWGHPTTYPLNGTNRGATANARNERISTLANLPVCVDEITHMPNAEAVAFAMSVTQPTGRLRLSRTGTESKTHSGSKSTIVLTTANSSLHTLLSYENSSAAAGSMRVLEVPFLGTFVHKKFEAEDFLHELSENYGHIGPVFIQHVIQNREAVEERLRTLMREVDAEANVVSAERFWSAAVASALAAGEIANKLGLVAYDVATIREWATQVLIPSARVIVSDEYSTPLSILTDYIVESYGSIVITSEGAIQGAAELKNSPKNKVLGHYDQSTQMLWLLRKGFKDYCSRIGANDRKILQDLGFTKMGDDGKPLKVVVHERAKKVLGYNTDFATAQVWCCAINMAHPEVMGDKVIQKVLTPKLVTNRPA